MEWAQVDEEQLDYYSCDDASTSEDEAVSTAETNEKVEDDDSDVDADVARAHGPKTTSEKRRAQNEIMRSFVANISATVTQKEVDEAAAKSANEEQLSIRDILKGQETTVRITNPRDYQTELFQRAKEENIIAVLDTGSGKTHIATLLLRHILDEELENRAKGAIHKTAFFLVRLCTQLTYMTNLFRSTR
jgi:endoribonuclease Dicer